MVGARFAPVGERMRTVRILGATVAAALMLAGCNGSSLTATTSTTTGPTSNPEQMGATVNGTFQIGAISTTVPSGSQLSSGGSTQLSLQFQVTKTGAAATDAIAVAFSSKCPAGTVTIAPATVTNSTGSVSATYTNSGGCNLSQDTVTATASGASSSLTNTTATTTIALAAAIANSIVFKSAAPTNIGLKGTGQPSTSSVTFEVETAGGGPVAGATVNFTLSTSVGGIALVNTSAVTGTDGLAVATVQSGTRAASVSVTATAQTASGPVTADSNNLTITTGIPDAQSMSLAAGGCNIQGFNHDGLLVPVTMRMKDRFSNPVPDGTAVIFSTSGGGIQGQCTTTTTPAESGLCMVNWVSQNPRPVNAGRARIIGVAVGEKHFTDTYGLGYFVGPPEGNFAVNDPFIDIGDPFRDDNESGAYVAGDVFYDINGNKTYQGPNGDYVGLLCGGPSPTTLPTACGGKNNSTMYVSSQLTLIMSTDASQAGWPAPSWRTGSMGANGSLNVVAGLNTVGSDSLSALIMDANGNPPAAGTVITVINLPTVVTLGQPSSFTTPCSNAVRGVGIPVFFTFSEPAGTSTHGTTVVSISMTSPGDQTVTPKIGALTTFQSVTINY
jgi:hypothetical protein